MLQKITILKIRKRAPDNVNDELQFIGNSLGLFSIRDRNSSCFRVFIILLRNAKKSEIISSDEIAERLHLTRGTVVHHLNMLINSGLVVRERGGYVLRERNLEKLIVELKREVDTTFSDLMMIAKNIDSKLG